LLGVVQVPVAEARVGAGQYRQDLKENEHQHRRRDQRQHEPLLLVESKEPAQCHARLSYRGLSPVSSHPSMPELAARWIPGTGPGTTTVSFLCSTALVGAEASAADLLDVVLH